MLKINFIFIALLISTNLLADASTSTVDKDKNKKEDSISTKQSATTSSSSSTATSTTTVLPGNNQLTQRNKYSAFISATAITDSKQTSDDTKDYNSSLALILGYQLNSDYRLGLVTSLVKNLNQTYEENINDSTFSVAYKPVALGNGYLVIPRALFTIPTSKNSKVRDDMNGAASVAGTFIKQVNSKLSLVATPLITAYSHKYTTNRINNVNKQYSASESLNINYSFTDKFFTSASLQFAQSWSYRGTKRDDQYGTDFSANYMPQSQVTVSAGISTGGQIYRNQKGPDSAIEVYDPNSTSFYLNYVLSI